MIEFAPNPTGPAHLGTLRTYAVAWLEAKRTGTRLFVRFDAHTPEVYRWVQGDPPVVDDVRWAEQFLEELRLLDMTPDGWQYFTETIKVGAVPEWARIVESPQRRHRTACYPLYRHPRYTPSSNEKDWQLGAHIPMTDFGSFRDRDFAVQRVDGTEWQYNSVLVSAIHMQLRGARAVVRALNMSGLRPYGERPAQQWFGLRLPRQIMTSMVVGKSGALSKHTLQPNDIGTVGWALTQLGAPVLREKVLASAGDASALPIISVEDLLGVSC